MTSRASIDAFYGSDRIAVIGASASGQRFGAAAYKELKRQGYSLVPVHPTAETIGDDPAVHSVAELPDDVDAALLVVKPEHAEALIPALADAGVRRVWLQQGAESDAALEAARERDLDVVSGHCVIMYTREPGFGHRVHRWVWDLIGKTPA